MKSTCLQAAIAAVVCASQPMAAVAQSSVESFALNTSNGVYNHGVPATKGTRAGLSYTVVDGHAIAEGDIVLGRVNHAGQVIGDLQRGLSQGRLFNRWTNGIIPYQYSSETSEAARALTEQAIAQWNHYTSIMMVELDDENRNDFSNFLSFEANSGCASYVGMHGGEQELWISANCGVGSIVHEIGHAVGLFHEHTRSDRDNFIQVNHGNIVDGKELNFDVLNTNTELLGAYDYGSIMHYGEAFFSANGSPTITAFNGAQIGQRIALSDGDIASVNQMYKTDLSLHVEARDEPIDDQIIVDVQVTNQGRMGANQLSLSVEIGAGASWLSVSPDSGWECTLNGAALKCDRISLDASSTSLFTVVAEANGSTASQVSVELIANTRESDYQNNGHNKTVTAPAILSALGSGASGIALADSSNDSQSQTIKENVPVIGAANLDDTIAQSSVGFDVAETSSGGGALSPLTGFGMFLAIVGLRLRRRS